VDPQNSKEFVNQSPLSEVHETSNNFLSSSQCATDPQQIEFLKGKLQKVLNKKFTAALRYRGSRDGWKAKDFHSKSDNLGPSICLFQNDENHCFGGFTSEKWQSPKQTVTIKDPTAFLFNLTN
jgi:hypothetical protein